MSNLDAVIIDIDPSVLMGGAPTVRMPVLSTLTSIGEDVLQALRDVRHMLPREGVAIVDAVLHRTRPR